MLRKAISVRSSPFKYRLPWAPRSGGSAPESRIRGRAVLAGSADRPNDPESGILYCSVMVVLMCGVSAVNGPLDGSTAIRPSAAARAPSTCALLMTQSRRGHP
jgi:hypothetical protein